MGDEPEAQQKQECGGTQGGVDPKIWRGAEAGVWGECQRSFSLHQRHVRVAGRGAQELRHREASGGGSGAPSVPQPALSLLITGRRAGNMMEDADKTTAEEIQMNPTEKSSSGCTTAFYFFQCCESPARQGQFLAPLVAIHKKAACNKGKKKEN